MPFIYLEGYETRHDEGAGSENKNTSLCSTLERYPLGSYFATDAGIYPSVTVGRHCFAGDDRAGVDHCQFAVGREL